MDTYSHDMAPDHCSFCKRPFINGEVFGILPEDPTVCACDLCAEHHYKSEKALLLEVHLTGQPIQGEEEMRAAHKTIKFFKYMLEDNGDDPRIIPFNSDQRAYLEERLGALMKALNEIEVTTLPEGDWGIGRPTR